MELEISVVTDCLDWTLGGGIRELIQNFVDADAKGYLSRINYDRENRILKMKSEGSTIPLECLLIGYTPKNDIGESLKLGCMSLLKNGQNVKIKNGDQIWTPIIRKSKTFPDKEILALQVDKTDSKSDDVEIFVGNLNDFDWQRIKGNFLIFTSRQKYFSYETPFGYIIEGANEDSFAGKVYINGLLIEGITDETYRFGYNIHPGWLTVDRDRKMANRTSLKNLTSQMWCYLAEGAEHFKSVEKLLMDDSMDLIDAARFGLPAELKDRIYRNFIKFHGKNAYPVVNSEEASEIALIGKDPVMSGKAYTKIIRSRLGDMMMLRRDFQRGIKVIFPLNNLSQMERDNFNRAKRLLSEVVDVPMVKICEFVSPETQSLYVSETITIFISREILKNFQETLRMLVREYCRKWGSCGSLYESELETVWSSLYLRLMNGVASNADDGLRQSGEERN